MIPVYTDILDAPLDTPPPDIGDWMADGSHALTLATTEQMLTLAAPALIVPFTREIKRGSTGTDVRGAKRPIWRATGTAGLSKLTTTFGPTSVRLLKEFQHTHGLTADGVLGPATLRKLAPFFDRYAFYLYEGYQPGENPIVVKRNRMLAYLVWGYNQRALIWYAQFRPMQMMGDLFHLPVAEDCSTYYTKGAKAADWKDPNGFNYNGTGNTETLVVHGRQVDLAHAQIGDAVLYSSPQHVGGYVGGGRIISLGSSAGPSLTDAHYRGDYWQTRSYF